jgi:hypothetical protein
MATFQARAVHVLADTDHGEGWVSFEWADQLTGWDELKVDLDGHCSRRMPIHSGSGGVEAIELSRDRIRFRFTESLAHNLGLEPDVEIAFAVSDAVFADLQRAVAHLVGCSND